MLQDLSERSRKVSEVLLFERVRAFVASEIERGQKSVLGKGPKQESLTVVGTCRDECNQGIEQKKVKRREHRSIVALSTRNVSLSTDDTCWMPRPTCEVKAPHM